MQGILMVTLGNIGIDYKFTAAFAIVALLLSLITGIFSGVSFDVIAIRLLIILPVYSAIGYGIVFVSKKFVPELYNRFAELDSGENRNSENGGAEESGDLSGSLNENSPDSSDTTGDESLHSEEDESFTEITPEQYKKVDLSDELNSETESFSGGKLGKHVIQREKFVKYEPKLMAEAVRTMMSKDDD